MTGTRIFNRMNIETQALPVLDYEFLKQYSEFDRAGEKSIALQLAEKFLRNGEKRIESIEKAIQSDDKKSMVYETHSFKSSCGNIGAKKLFKICRELEENADKLPHSDLEALLGEIKKEHWEVKEALEQYIGLPKDGRETGSA